MTPLRFKLWNSDDCDSGHVTVRPEFVVSVVETQRRRAYGGNNNVAIIRLSDGKEYCVEDDGRKVQDAVWAAQA